MVEYELDKIFNSLSDPTRRDILKRVSKSSLSINEIAGVYNMSLAAVSKHLKVLEKANLIVKRKEGKQYFVELAPKTLKNASNYLEDYKKFWEDRFEAMDRILDEQKKL